jgi:hypothetical protein
MATLAETGERIGIPTELLEDLIQLPIVVQALHSAAENPSWAPRTIWKGVGRPTIYVGEELKIEQLQIELDKRRELATRTTDGRIIPERMGGPLSTGRMQRAEAVAKRRLAVIAEVDNLMGDHYPYAKPYAESSSMVRVKFLLKQELELSEGREL